MLRQIHKSVIVIICLLFSTTSFAEPVIHKSSTKSGVVSSAIMLASLKAGDTRNAHGAMTPWVRDLRTQLQSQIPNRAKEIQVAGRCGSSKYYCNNPTPYCCGTPGNYYCAKNVNGCTR